MNQKHGTRVTGVDAAVLDLLCRHDWPGNVRELRNVLERAAIMVGVGLIGLANSGGAFQLSPGPYRTPASGPGSPRMLPPGQSLAEIDEAYIRITLDHVGGNRKAAAEMLGIGLRTLQSRIAAWRD